MRVKLLICFVCCFSFAHAKTKSFDVIKLDEIEEVESLTQLKFKERQELTKNLTQASPPKPYKFGSFEMGALQTNVSMNPLSGQASVSAQLDLIDSYNLMKSKPDLRGFVPYAIKNIRRDLGRNYTKLQEIRDIVGNNGDSL